VHAFEPIAFLAHRLKKICPSHVKVHNLALSDHKTKAMLHIPVKQNGKIFWGRASLTNFREEKHTYQSMPVEMARLDDFEFTNLSFIKIDVEGHEEEVLNGSKQTLQKHRPVLYIELEERRSHKNIFDMFTFIKQLGFEGFFLHDGCLKHISTFTKEQHGVPKTKDYIYNFIFVPSLPKPA